MKMVNVAMACCTKKTCKRRVITETVCRKCPICGSPTRKEKKLIAKFVEVNDKSYIILKEKGNKVNDNNKRKTTKNKKQGIPRYGRGFSSTNL